MHVTLNMNFKITCQFDYFEKKLITLTVGDRNENLQEYLILYYSPAGVTKASSHFFITNTFLEKGERLFYLFINWKYLILILIAQVLCYRKKCPTSVLTFSHFFFLKFTANQSPAMILEAIVAQAIFLGFFIQVRLLHSYILLKNIS